VSLLLGYNTNGFAHHALDEIIEILAEIGYRSVGLTLDVHHAPPETTDFRALGAHFRARGLLPVVETGARFLLDPRHKHQPSLLSRRGRSRRLDFYFAALDAAVDLGAPCVSLWSGRDEGGDSWRLLVDGLDRLCVRADAAGVDLAFEPEPGMFIATMAQFDELRRRLPHPRLGLTLDIGHLHCLESKPPETYVRRYAGLLRNVHLDDQRRGRHEHLFFGEGEIDFPPVIAALAGLAKGRDLPATVELSRLSHDAFHVARRAYEILGRWLAASR